MTDILEYYYLICFQTFINRKINKTNIIQTVFIYIKANILANYFTFEIIHEFDRNNLFSFENLHVD